jgi:hypothetical protein
MQLDNTEVDQLINDQLPVNDQLPFNGQLPVNGQLLNDDNGSADNNMIHYQLKHFKRLRRGAVPYDFSQLEFNGYPTEAGWRILVNGGEYRSSKFRAYTFITGFTPEETYENYKEGRKDAIRMYRREQQEKEVEDFLGDLENKAAEAEGIRDGTNVAKFEHSLNRIETNMTNVSADLQHFNTIKANAMDKFQEIKNLTSIFTSTTRKRNRSDQQLLPPAPRPALPPPAPAPPTTDAENDATDEENN